MTAPAFLPARPAVPLSAIRAASERNQAAARAASMHAEAARSFADRQPVLPTADAIADRTWPQFDGWVVTLMRAQSYCGAGRNAEMCGELEDLERLIGEALRGAA